MTPAPHLTLDINKQQWNLYFIALFCFECVGRWAMERNGFSGTFVLGVEFALYVLIPILSLLTLNKPSLHFLLWLLLLCLFSLVIVIQRNTKHLPFNLDLIKLFIPYRFFFLYVLIAKLDFIITMRSLENLLRSSTWLIFPIAVAQAFENNAVFDLTLPAQGDDSPARVAKDYESWDGSAWGLFNNQISLAYFGFFATLLLSNKYKITSIASFIIIVLSGSMFVTLFTAISIAIYKKKYKTLVIGAVIFSIFWINLVEYFFPTLEYDDIWFALQQTRLGLITSTLPAFFTSAPDLYSLFLGFGSHPGELGQIFNNQRNVPLVLTLSDKFELIEDVYWVAILYYFGIIGVFFYFLSFYLIAFTPWLKTPPSEHEITALSKAAFLFLVFGNFVNQTSSVSIFIFLLVMLCGIRASFVRAKTLVEDRA